MFHDTGTLLVEDLTTTSFDNTSFTSKKQPRGVSITIKCSLGRFDIMGLVVDEVENLISNWYPGTFDGNILRGIKTALFSLQMG